MMLSTSAYDLAKRFVGIKETKGNASTPAILAMLQLDDAWPADDAVPWCSAFLNYVAWLVHLPRSKSLAAVSWLNAGRPITLDDAENENDVVILKFSNGGHHVGLFAGLEGAHVLILGGNQGDAVSIAAFARTDVIGVRRLTA